jgi:hypothetical protein
MKLELRFDIVSLDDFDQATFNFNGTIGATKIAYPKK